MLGQQLQICPEISDRHVQATVKSLKQLFGAGVVNFNVMLCPGNDDDAVCGAADHAFRYSGVGTSEMKHQPVSEFSEIVCNRRQTIEVQINRSCFGDDFRFKLIHLPMQLPQKIPKGSLGGSFGSVDDVASVYLYSIHHCLSKSLSFVQIDHPEKYFPFVRKTFR